MASRDDVKTVLNLMVAAFPNFNLREQTPEAYFELLGDLSADELKAAVLECCSEPGRAFAPSVGEVRGAALAMRRKILGVPSAMDAWGEVMQQINDEGHDRTPHFSNEIITTLVRRFGWSYLCLSENEMVDRAHFIKAYDLAVEEAMHSELRLPAVTKYIEDRKPAQLEVKAGIKQLAERLRQ